MIKVLFVCHGNICRSPMAEFVFKDMLNKRGITGVAVQSCATSTEELGGDIYPPAQRKLRMEGVPFEHRRAVQITAADMDAYDYIVVMDGRNIANLRRMFGQKAGRAVMLMSYTDTPGDVADPWYSGNFDAAYDDIVRGCEGLLAQIESASRA